MSSDVAKHRDTKNRDRILRSGLAGGIAGCVVRTLQLALFSFLIIFRLKQWSRPSTELKYSSKRRIQTTRNTPVRHGNLSSWPISSTHFAGSWRGAYRAGTRIFQESGTRGLFQGHSATLLRVFPYAAIKFMAYDHIHSVSIHLLHLMLFLNAINYSS